MRYFLISVLLAAGCNEDSLAPDVAQIIVTPMPAEGTQQRAYEGPTGQPGVDLGKVPLHGLANARFAIENPTTATLRIEAAQVRSQTNASVEIVSFPEKLKATQTDELVISLAPAAHEVAGDGIIALSTNAGDKQDKVVDVLVRGEGLFIGSPNLEIQYSGQAYPRAGDCADRGDGKNLCTLAPLDFGNVALATRARQSVKLLNLPPAGTCIPPPGSAPCTAVCRLRIDRDPTGDNLGIGIDPADAGFRLEANVSVPFEIDALWDVPCKFRNEKLASLEFTAPAQATDASATLILETNDADAPFIRIPLIAAAREAPVAVAKLRECDPAQPDSPCTDPLNIRPLDTVYLDGRDSYDPNGLPIVDYRWRIIEWPVGAQAEGFKPTCVPCDPTCGPDDPPCFLSGADSSLFDVWLPLAGRYVARLQVTNQTGVSSGVSPSSDIEFVAIPSSRVHIQLIWDNATNDQDLHVTCAEAGDLVCDTGADCFWNNCKPECKQRQPDGQPCLDLYDCVSGACSAGACAPVACVDNSDCLFRNCNTAAGECSRPQAPCAATPPPWDAGVPLTTGPNPRLDIDDTNGYGPENINIDAPRVGRYWVYVHYYGLRDPKQEPTAATVRVYVDGVFRAEYRRTLEANELWRVATIDWATDRVVVAPVPGDGIGLGQTTLMIGCTDPCDFEIGCL